VTDGTGEDFVLPEAGWPQAAVRPGVARQDWAG